jgi:hypothetical protein
MRESALTPILLSLICALLAILGSAAETAAFSVSSATSQALVPRRSAHPAALGQLTNLQASQDVEDEHDPVTIVDSETKHSLSRKLVPTIALLTLASVSLAAKFGVLPGPLTGGGGYGPYTDAMIARDAGSALLTGSLGYAFVKGNTWLADKGYLDPKDSRKIIHTLSAPLFILFWPLFSEAVGARWFAASVSFVNVIRLYIAGSGGDESLAYAVSRYVQFGASWMPQPEGPTHLSGSSVCVWLRCMKIRQSR